MTNQNESIKSIEGNPYRAMIRRNEEDAFDDMIQNLIFDRWTDRGRYPDADTPAFEVWYDSQWVMAILAYLETILPGNDVTVTSYLAKQHNKNWTPTHSFRFIEGK